MAATHHYVGVLLAAGTGSRYLAAMADATDAHVHKLLATLPEGQCVAEASAKNVLAALPHTIAVVADSPPELPSLLHALGCTILPAPLGERGMGISLAAAAAYLLANTPVGTPLPGCVVTLADMPWLRKETIQDLLHHASPDQIVVPIFNGQRGHPVVFGAQFLPELAALDGDTGARSLLLRYGALEIHCNDPGVIRDVDVPEDLRFPAKAL